MNTKETIRLVVAGLALAGTAGADVGYRVVAETGDVPFPAAPAVTYEAFFDGGLFSQSAAINNAGELAVWARLQGPGIVAGSNDDYLLGINAAGVATEIARQGDVVPNAMNPTFETFQRPRINEAGQVAFKAGLDDTTPPFNERVYRWTQAGGLETVYEKGGGSQLNPAVNIALGQSALTLLENGNIAVSSLLTGIGVTVGVNDGAIVMKNGAANVGSFFRNDPAPVPGATLGVISKMFVEDPSRPAFLTTLDGPAAGEDTAILVGFPNGLLTVVALEGQPALGIPGSIFADLASASLAYNGSSIVFRATVEGGGAGPTNNTALWAGNPANPALLLREGDPAPGVAGRVLANFASVAINAGGRIAFSASLVGGGFGIWLTDDAGAFVPVAFPGMASPKPGDGRAVSTAFFFNSESGLSDSGELALALRFASGDEMLVTARYLVPDDLRPVVRIDGKKRIVTQRSRFRVKGRASDAGGLARVEIRVGSQKKWRPAKGLSRWKIRKPIRLRADKTRVRVRAIDEAGNVSAIKRQVLIVR